jgi:serine/threonine protein phosphatase 1
LLDELLEQIDADIALRPTVRPFSVFLGDYIDRGPSSRETIDRLIKYGATHESVFLKGNHELIAIRCLTDPNVFDQWMRLGGLETLKSYGAAPKGLANGKQIAELQSAFHHALPRAHLRFFRNLQSSFACGDFFFAHAGVKPNVDLSQQQERDLLWIRGEFLSSNEDFGKIVVHGHTPIGEIEVASNRINIDTGAFATGRLTSLVIEDESLSVIDTALGA